MELTMTGWKMNLQFRYTALNVKRGSSIKNIYMKINVVAV
jgi:hypothetical protein